MQDMIYHYCSVGTFLNILQHKTIRLSDLNKLNDDSEMKALLEPLTERLTSLLTERFSSEKFLILGCDNKTAIRVLVNLIIQKIYKHTNTLIYGACFSKNNDLLSQWCKYADNTQGVAIGFNTSLLKKLVDFGNSIANDEQERLFSIEEVCYLPKGNVLPDEFACHAQEMADMIYYLINSQQTDTLISESESLGGFLSLDRTILLQSSARFKGYNFREEEEVRIIFNDDLDSFDDSWAESYRWKEPDLSSPIQKLFPSAMQFRATENNIISYFDLDFSKYSGYNDSIIREIVLGPNCHLSFADISHLLLHFNFFNVDEINIMRSKSTYRI